MVKLERICVPAKPVLGEERLRQRAHNGDGDQRDDQFVHGLTGELRQHHAEEQVAPRDAKKRREQIGSTRRDSAKHKRGHRC